MASSVRFLASNYDNVVLGVKELPEAGGQSVGGGEGDSLEEELDDIISEIRDIDSEGGQTDEPSDDELNKTPDEGEQELTWIKDAGLENIAHRYEEGKEITEDIVKKETATLTRNQANAVIRRVSTLNDTIRKKQKQRNRSDARTVFLQTEPVEIQDDSGRSSPEDTQRNGGYTGHVTDAGSTRPLSRTQQRKESKKVTIVRLPSRGEYSMHGKANSRDGGVEAISIQQKELPPSPDATGYRPITLVDNDLTISFKSADTRNQDEGDSAAPVMRKPNTKAIGLPDFILEPDALGVTRVSDLSKKDLQKIRPLALLELTALFDQHEISFSARKSKKRHKDSGVFGVPLQTLYDQDCRKHPNIKVPIFYRQLINHLEHCGLDEEGILRVPGSATRIKQLRQEIEDKFASGRFSWDEVNVNDAASMFKQLIRELPVPLLTFEYFEAFSEVEGIPDKTKKQQLQALNLLILMLPEVHRNTLQLLLVFLNKVVACSENKMTLNNVAMIMAPNLFLIPNQRKHKSPELDITYAARKSNIVRMMMKYYDILWTVPSFILSQVRSQFETEQARKSKDKSSLMKFLGRKEKHEPLKKPPIQNEADFNQGIVRVCHPAVSKDTHPVQLDASTTAYDIVAQIVQSSDQPDSSSVGSSSSRDPFLSTTHLHEVGGNIGERRLDHNTNMLELYKVNPNAQWLIRTSAS